MPNTLVPTHEFAPPKKGPRILFFSGGTALKDTARALTRYTYNSLHLITPFDSGGSSQTLRRAFNMPAVGDVRSRVIALADHSLKDGDILCKLFNYRLPEEGVPEEQLRQELVALATSPHPYLEGLSRKSELLIRENLSWFLEHMPDCFALAGANIGNLFLAARYLRSNRRLRPAILLFSRLMRTRGTVLPIVDIPAHLAVCLESGKTIVGQHNFTGKPGVTPAQRLESPIADCWLTASETSATPIPLTVTPHIARRIRNADAICYPIGSFYSSVLANLLPGGVGKAVMQNKGPKIFVPNLGSDPELLGHSIQSQAERLLSPLLKDAPGAHATDMLTMVLVDTERGIYPGGIPEAWFRAQGIQVKNVHLVSPESAPLADPKLLANALFTLAAGNP